MAVSYVIPQAYSESLSNIALLAGTSGLLRKTGADSWGLDTSEYLSGVVGIQNGGTGATDPTSAINNLLPNQQSNGGKLLGTDGSELLWVSPAASSGSVSYAVMQDLTLSQINQFRSNVLIGSSPTIVYDLSGRVSTITYSDGSVKSFEYDLSNNLTRIDHVYASPSRTVRKDFTYVSGKLVEISETFL